MAPPRRVVPDNIVYDRQGDTTVLRPQAAPVNTFADAAQPLKSPLWDLTDALRTINPKLDRYVDNKLTQQAYEDARDAEAKAMVATSATWDEAIKKGEAPAGASPLYQRVYTETLGKISGLNKAQAEVWQEWVSPNNAVRTTQDPTVIAQWFNERRQKYLDGQSPDWVKGFAPAFAQVQQQLTQRIIADNVKYIEQANHDALGQLFMDRILAGAASGQSPQAIAAQLSDDALPQRFAGMQGKEINTVMAKAIIAAAQKTGNTGLLQVGYQDRPDLKNPGQTIRGVFSVPEFAQAADSAATSILAKGNAMETRRQLNEARAEKVAAKNILGSFVTKRIDDPNWEPSADELKAAVKVMPDFMSHWRVQKEAMRKDATPRFDPIAFNALAASFIDGIRQGKDVTPLISAMAPFGTASQLIEWNKMAQDSSILKSDAYKIGDQSLQKMQDTLLTRLDPTQAAAATNAARQEFMSYAWNYQQAILAAGGKLNPDKMGADFTAKIEAMAAEIKARHGIVSPKPDVAQASPATQQTNAQQPQGAPASVTDALNIVPLSREASGPRRWPNPGVTWQAAPPDAPQLTAEAINALRTNPFKTNAQGVQLWQQFEQTFGPGSVSYFINNNPNAIARKLRGK